MKTEQQNKFIHSFARLGLVLALLILFPGIAPTQADRTQGELDLGDAPDQFYQTLLTSSGASHVLGSGVYLGSCVDAEPDGQPSAGADGDDTNISSPVYGTCIHSSDEDGVAFTTPLDPGETAEVAVMASAPCTLSAWVDFNGDLDWADSGENIFPGGEGLVTGFNSLTFAVPSDVAEGNTYARFRCTTDGAVSYAGEASDGEVEDYQVRIGVNRDLGDAPDRPYPTWLGNSGASHVLGSDVYLGSCVDAEPDGQPTVAANGDDTGIGSPVYGTCTAGDDEDGVTFLTPLNPGEIAEIEVVASLTCTLSAWIDYYSNGDWSDPIDELFPDGRLISPGSNYLTFMVSQDTEGGGTYARFRCTTDGVVSYKGEASDGEVEDYPVWIGAPIDLGDAPDPTYPTLWANSGAYHFLGSEVYLGACVDAEPDGQPSAYANGDDLNGDGPAYGSCPTGDDEDGVIFTTPLLPGGLAGVTVIANAPCDLYAWVDFNGNGDWTDTGERIFTYEALSAGANPLSFAVPPGATVGETYARFRCVSDYEWLEPYGYAPNGEVEDYKVQIGSLPLDLGDAPDKPYRTLLASIGASHVLGSGIYLGACVDAEPDGQPSAGADGDDTSIGSPVYGSCSRDDDEDGVVFLTPLYAGKMAGVAVEASAPCVLSAWVDFNASGNWLDADENLFPGGQVLAAGINSLSFAVPPWAVEGDTYARFRCTTSGATLPVGLAPDGEVEDYQVTVSVGRDFGDAPDPTYPTLLASSGASHKLGSGVYLGACVDAEPDGQPSTYANGDDVNIGGPIYGDCGVGDDEDGVFFLTPLFAGSKADIEVVASAPCVLSAWIDFDDNGSWADAGEDIFPGGQALVAGANVLTFEVPPEAVEGPVHARFRCTTDGVVPFVEEASDGEVEDYRVHVGPPLDFGDAPDPSYPTLLVSEGASHVLGSDVYLGTCVDAEADGQPTESADGDDAHASPPAYGDCTGGSDEDGVIFTTPLTVGTAADIEVTANAACMLNAWIDFNHDGDWLDDGEVLFPGGQPLVAGTNLLSFAVPMVSPGAAYARFRCATEGAGEPIGRAPDGEVEDYPVTILGHAVYLSLVLKE